MNSDFDNALYGLRGKILDFDINSFTFKDIIPSKAQDVLTSALFSKSVQDMKVIFDMTTRHEAILGCLLAAHAQNFLLAILIDVLGQYMSLVKYHTILRYHIMTRLFPIDEVCHVCRKACLDTFGEHAVHCKELPGFKCRHDSIRDVFFNIFKRVGVSVTKEAPMNFLNDHSLEDRYLGLQMIRCTNGKEETCMCGLDWGFTTRWIRGRSFYGRRQP
jgi:hypothetical protein